MSNWFVEHKEEFRLKCMIGQQKGYARIAADKGDKEGQLYHLQRAEYYKAELNMLLNEEK